MRVPVAVKERGNDVVCELSVEVAAENQSVVDRADEGIGGAFCVRGWLDGSSGDAVFHDGGHLVASSLYDRRAEGFPELRVDGDLGQQCANYGPVRRRSQGRGGVHDDLEQLCSRIAYGWYNHRGGGEVL